MFLVDFTARLRFNLSAMLPSFVKQFFLASEIKSSTSTPLDPLLKFMGLGLIAILILKEVEGLPSWTIPMLVAMLILFFFAVGFYSLFLFIKNPDVLRSGQFMIQKMVIERVLGDDIYGKSLQNSGNLKKLLATDTDSED